MLVRTPRIRNSRSARRARRDAFSRAAPRQVSLTSRESKYGLTPLQYPDYAALRGDPSDNLPGIPGVGEKTAAKWIREFGSLTTLVDRVDEVRGKVGDALREALPSVLMNRRLTACSSSSC